MLSIEQADQKKKMEAQEERAFTEWLEKRETKLLMSMIPAADNPDVLQILLRSCFAHGHCSGQGCVAMVMLEALLKDRPNS